MGIYALHSGGGDAMDMAFLLYQCPVLHGACIASRAFGTVNITNERNVSFFIRDLFSLIVFAFLYKEHPQGCPPSEPAPISCRQDIGDIWYEIILINNEKLYFSEKELSLNPTMQRGVDTIRPYFE